ncbi:MAG: adenosylcobinamide-GDP ribazoletransferase, partial [Kiloniellaceae bacterium]
MQSAADLAAWWTDLKVGLAMLTRLPLRHDAETSGQTLARAGRVMPLIGALVGLVGAAVFWLAGSLGLPPLVAGLLAVTATMLFTGAFHEDGLADVADGFGGAFERNRKLEIMRESTIGAYGALALILSVGVRAAALGAIAEPAAAAAALVAAHAVARSFLPAVMVTTPLARTEGLAAGAGEPAPGHAGVALILAAVIAVAMLGLGTGVLSLALSAAAAAAMVL